MVRPGRAYRAGRERGKPRWVPADADARDLADSARPALRYDVPGVDDRPTRTALARLQSLYTTALEHSDQPVIDLVTSLRPTP
ncbi:hypothetical protein ACFXKG_01235 [Streptomyces sp. NPDC059255]|uniref:hypothetical protein n=1 Tax=Streptomyces sp. NPDC059255 TaxID=3346793 RepID=UPI00368FF261